MSQAPRLRMAAPQPPAASPQTPSGIRIAYIAGRDRAREADVWRVADAWNALIPAKKIRVLSDERWVETLAVLRLWGVEEVLLGLRCYAGQTWQRTYKAWKRYESWLGVSTQWIEEALADADRVEAAADRAAAAEAESRQRAAEKAAERAREADARRRMGSMRGDELKALLARAEADLRKAGGFRRVNAATIAQHAVRMLVWEAAS